VHVVRHARTVVLLLPPVRGVVQVLLPVVGAEKKVPLQQQMHTHVLMTCNQHARLVLLHLKGIRHILQWSSSAAVTHLQVGPHAPCLRLGHRCR
jgi:hypothetical protein